VSLKLTQIGGQDRILAVVRDISERKLAEAALKESEQQLRLLASRLLHAQEKERHRLSRELHDELGQALTVLKIHLGAIDNKLRKDQQKLKGDCEHLLNHINNIIANVRRLSWDLSPTILEDLGLSSALRHLIDETCANHDMACSIELDEIDPLFSPEAKTHIYRFFQEALNNLSKHSQATSFSAKVTRQDDQVSFTLVDNGRGFEVDQAQSQNVREKRLGLTTMNERARMAGGSLQIWSRPGKGARLTFTLPTDRKGP
jgi:signal transduction histidine kinase